MLFAARQLAVTSEVRAVAERGQDLVVGLDDVHDALLNEVHFGADGALANYEIAGLEDLEAQLGYHVGHKVRIGVREERHGRNERATIEINDVLFFRCCC